MSLSSTPVLRQCFIFSGRKNTVSGASFVLPSPVGFRFRMVITCARKMIRRYGDTSLQKLLSSQVLPERERISTIYTGPAFADVEKVKAERRRLVYEFLKTEGISPDDLDGLELPVTVEVMRERIDFLHQLGLTIDDINRYPLVLGCSVKKNMVPVLEYLGRLGIERSSIGEFLKRYPQVLHASIVIDLEPVVKHLLGLDIHAIDIPKVLRRYPELLGFKIDGTMSTSVAYLIGIGVSRREIGRALTTYPEILGMRVGRIIKPFVEYLEDLGMERLSVVHVIEELPCALGFDLESMVKPNVAALEGVGLGRPSIASVLLRHPNLMGIDLGPRIADRRRFFAATIGADVDEYASIVENWPPVIGANEKMMLKHLEFLRGCGISTEKIKEMVMGCPIILALNIELMQESFDFFRTEMRGDLDDLVLFPAFFTYGLDSTVKPRHRKATEKGIQGSLRWLLNCSDEKFAKRMTYDITGADEKPVHATV